MSSEANRKAEAARWLRYALEDLRAAKASGEAALADRHRCMLAQQASEKALKAVLISIDIDPPRTHDLRLLMDLIPGDGSVRSVQVNLGRLSQWIVESRYPGDWPDATSVDAEMATADASKIVDAVVFDIERARQSR